MLIIVGLAFLPISQTPPAAHESQEIFNFPGDGCYRTRPKRTPKEITCLQLTSSQGMKDYIIRHRLRDKPLARFSRSVKVIVNKTNGALLVNNYEGSNYTDCSVFWSPNSARPISIAEAWSKRKDISPEERKLTTLSDHTYFTCDGWSEGSALFTVKLDDNQGGYYTSRGSLNRSGEVKTFGF